MRSGEPFVAGESCLLSDSRGRQYLVTLTDGSTFQSDKGYLRHSDIIGAGEGVTLRTNNGSPIVAMRPRLVDYVLRMKRGAAVLYPKDAGPIITWGDIDEGSVVLEAGTGSGALTLALSRAVGRTGRVITVERREDHAVHAARLVHAFHGATPTNIDFRTGDVADVIADAGADRIVLDLPEPWTIVPLAARHLPGGGVFICYLPTVPQVQQVRTAMDETRSFTDIETFEVLMRGWTIDGPSVRPDHRMVGHTGFLTVGRKRLPKPVEDVPLTGSAEAIPPIAS
jgi:tRNA (adenine57-N1/adenine58-N1)-methyltransferase catalytic subunit